ncbi:hypothetical protein AMTRI_Chr11g96710 [Amborella trichopoda]
MNSCGRFAMSNSSSLSSTVKYLVFLMLSLKERPFHPSPALVASKLSLGISSTTSIAIFFPDPTPKEGEVELEISVPLNFFVFRVRLSTSSDDCPSAAARRGLQSIFYEARFY